MPRTKKKKDDNCYRFDESDDFMFDGNNLIFTLRGRPQPWKRPGRNLFSGQTFITNKAVQSSLQVAFKALLLSKQLNDRIDFGMSELELSVVFGMTKQRVTSRPDLDNLLKNLLDALQKTSIYNDDAQVTRIVGEKRLDVGGKGYTQVRLAKRVIEID